MGCIHFWLSLILAHSIHLQNVTDRYTTINGCINFHYELRPNLDFSDGCSKCFQCYGHILHALETYLEPGSVREFFRGALYGAFEAWK